MISQNLCPVCGYEMDAPPKDYRICPSCGTEFGLHDVNATIADLRDSWLATGPKWWSKTDQPTGWDPLDQMAKAGIVIKRQPSSESSSVSTSSSTAVVAGRGLGWTASPSAQPGGIPHAVEFR